MSLNGAYKLLVSMIRFGVKTSQAGVYGDYAFLKRIWLEAEQLGFDSGWLFDHFFELPGKGLPQNPVWKLGLLCRL